MAAEKTSSSERQQTNESLRIERDKTDDVIGSEQSEIDDAADAVVERARARADVVLAAARTQMDRKFTAEGLSSQSRKIVATARAAEDTKIGADRVTADEIVRAERTEHAAALAAEREVTDQDLSRERAGADDAVATRDEFLGVVSHDLRNMLGSLVGFAQLIESEESRENHAETVVAFTKRIRRTGARMNRLIGDLVDLASIHAGSLAVTRELGDPAPVVMEAVETFQAQAALSGISLLSDIAPSSARVAFDAARILQVLANLLGNALKFTARGGTVIVSSRRVDDDLRFCVQDDGIGIPADRLDDIFERFLQVADDRRGVGLGLYISRCIVQGHDGRIWAESGLSKGTSFYFTLPIDGADATLTRTQ